MLKKIIKWILKYPLMFANRIYSYNYYNNNSLENYNIDDMFIAKKNILVLAPHVDDETIGVGGTLLKYREKGNKISIVYISDGGASTAKVSSEVIVKQRKKEGERIQKILGVNNLYFLDEPDGNVNSLNEKFIDKLINVFEKEKPDIIYTPFLIDAHSDHVETTKSLIKALSKWNSDFENIYMYEVNCPILPEVINSISIMDEKLFYEKKKLFKEFKSQSVMGFSAFTVLNRMKRLLTKKGYAAEVFVKSNVKNCEQSLEILNTLKFRPEYFRQLSSEYNFLLTFNKNKGLKQEYNLAIKKLLNDVL